MFLTVIPEPVMHKSFMIEYKIMEKCFSREKKKDIQQDYDLSVFLSKKYSSHFLCPKIILNVNTISSNANMRRKNGTIFFFFFHCFPVQKIEWIVLRKGNFITGVLNCHLCIIYTNIIHLD